MIDARIGTTVEVELPYTEVCIHLGVAGCLREVRVLEHGAQILNDDGSDFSFPITHGEAGIRAVPKKQINSNPWA